jgi:hypothetical protein
VFAAACDYLCLQKKSILIRAAAAEAMEGAAAHVAGAHVPQHQLLAHGSVRLAANFFRRSSDNLKAKSEKSCGEDEGAAWGAPLLP